MDNAISVLRPTLEHHTAIVAFGGLRAQESHVVIDEEGGQMMQVNAQRGNRSWDHRVSIDRCLASYVTAQAEAVATFVSDDGDSKSPACDIFKRFR